MIKQLYAFLELVQSAKINSFHMTYLRQRFAVSVCFAALDYPEKKRNLVSSIFSRKRWEAGMSKFLTLLLMEFLITLMKQSKKILKGALCTNMGVKNFSPLTHLGHTWCLFLLPALLLSLPPSVVIIIYWISLIITHITENIFYKTKYPR